MPIFLKSFNHKWMLNFVQGFFCIYWDDHMVFIFQFVNMVYHIGRFVYIEESLHSWNKPNLIMIYELFDVVVEFCFAKLCWGFSHLRFSVILAYSFLFVYCLCLVLVSGWWWSCRMSLEVFLALQFFEWVLEGQSLALLKCLIEFYCEAIWSSAFIFWKIFDHSSNFSACK